MNGVKEEEEEEAEEQSVTRFWKASLLSKATFMWLSPLLSTGSRRALLFEDVPGLSPEDSAQVVYERLQSNCEVEHHHQAGALKSLTWGLIKTFWPLFALCAFLASVKLSVMYVRPLLVQQFIDFSADPDRVESHGVKLVLILLLAKFTKLLVDHQYGFLSQRLGLSIQAALVASVSKSSSPFKLCSSNSQCGKDCELHVYWCLRDLLSIYPSTTCKGECKLHIWQSNSLKLCRFLCFLSNYSLLFSFSIFLRFWHRIWESENLDLLNTDFISYSKFVGYFLQIQDLWVLPLQIVLALVILYRIVGVATLTSFLTMLCVMLICLYIARKQNGIMVKIMACKDVWIKRTNEAVSNMKILKLQAWQDQFLQQVGCNKNVFSSWMNFFLELHLMTTCYDDLFMSYLKAVMLISTRFMQLMSGDWCTTDGVVVDKKTYIYSCYIDLPVMALSSVGFCAHISLLLAVEHWPHGRTTVHSNGNFRILQDPFRQFLWTMMQAAQALVSLNRLLKFFQSDELDLTAVEKSIQGQDGDHEFALTVHVRSYTLLLTLKHIAIWMTNLKCKDMEARMMTWKNKAKFVQFKAFTREGDLLPSSDYDILALWFEKREDPSSGILKQKAQFSEI